MDITITNAIIGLIGLTLLVAAIAYSFLIYHAPAPHGFTWVSVVLGFTFTDLAIIGVMIIVLVQYGLLDSFWGFAFIPSGAFILSGVPMIVGQEIKRRRETNDAKIIGKNYGKR